MNVKENLTIKIPTGYSVEIIDPDTLNPDRQDAAWFVYAGECELIATITRKSDQLEARVYCNGEMRYEWGELTLRNGSAILKETNFTTDKELNDAIERGEIIVENNAWFEVEVGEYGELGEIYDTAHEAVLGALELLQQEEGER